MSSNFPIALMNPALLEPHLSNWRIHPPHQRLALQESLSRFGWLEAVVWNETTGHILDGHARVEEALLAGAEQIPVRVVAYSAEEELEILASLDWLGEPEQVETFPQAQLMLLSAHLETHTALPLAYDTDEWRRLLAELDGNDPFEEGEEPEGAGSPPNFTVTILVPEGTYTETMQAVEALQEALPGGGAPGATILALLQEAVEHGW